MRVLRVCLTLVAVVAVVGLPSSATSAPQAPRPTLRRLGTVDLGILAETTPILWRGRTLLFECLQATYYNNTSPKGLSHLRFVDVLSGVRTPSFGFGHVLGNALVVNDTMYVHATVAPGGLSGNNTQVTVFWSTHDALAEWHSAVAFHARDMGVNVTAVWNTSVWPGPIPMAWLALAAPRRNATHTASTATPTRPARISATKQRGGEHAIPGAPRTALAHAAQAQGYLLAFEFEQTWPAKPVGGVWQTGLAWSTDLRSWSRVPDMPAPGSTFESTSHANPTLRFVAPYWYVITTRCTPHSCDTFVEEVFRSTLLAADDSSDSGTHRITWQARPGWRQDDILAAPLIAPNKLDQQAPNTAGFNPDTRGEVAAHAAAVRNATNINVSDMDVCDFVDPATGKESTLVYWAWGDQGLGLTAMVLAVGVVDAPLRAWLPSLF